jgi:ribokinase
MPPRITVVGSVNLDLVARVERLPAAGETLTGAAFERIPGGKGANQAVAAARLGADVRFVGCVGPDPFAAEAVRALDEAGVDLSRLKMTDEAPTGVALILVAADGENQIVVAAGANSALTPEDVDLGEHDAVLAQLEIPPETVAAAATTEKLFVLNAAPAREVPAELVRGAYLVVVNRHELEALPVQDGYIALTLGEVGAVLLEGGREVARAAPPPVEAVDGTAAGDAFTACLLVSLLEGRPREEALARACAAGALTASRPGAQPSLPTAAEVDEILRG